TATNADGASTAVSDPTVETQAPSDFNITGCPPVQEAGPLHPDEVNPPARLLIDRNLSTPRVIRRNTQTITLRFHVVACHAPPVRGFAVRATPTPSQHFPPAERAPAVNGGAPLTLRRLRFSPATPRQQNLVVFVRARKPGEDLLGGVSSRRLVSFRVN